MPSKELHSRAAPSVGGYHHRSVGPTTGRNPGGRQRKKNTFSTCLESLSLVNFSTAAFYRQATVEDEESPKMINVTFDADVIAYQMSPGSHSDKPGIFISGKCLRYIQVISLSKLKRRKIQSSKFDYCTIEYRPFNKIKRVLFKLCHCISRGGVINGGS